ncbi:MAG: hypothetical protein V4539_00870 [Bacteroidota bacterium]
MSKEQDIQNIDTNMPTENEPPHFPEDPHAIISPQTSPMEVHHHPHVEKKNFKEYLLEGLMIFLAVSMGFIAESIRENITKREHEHRLMEMLVQDFKEDIKKTDTAYKRNKIKILKLDTLRRLVFTAIEKELPDSDYRKMYYILITYGQSALPLRFVPTERALGQFEKNDAFNFVRKQNVSDSILNYKENNSVLISQFQIFREYYQLKAAEVAHQIFKSSLLEDFVDHPTINILSSKINFTLITRGKSILELYGFKLRDARSFLQGYTNLLQAQKTRAERLINLVEKEYQLENGETKSR